MEEPGEGQLLLAEEGTPEAPEVPEAPEAPEVIPPTTDTIQEESPIIIQRLHNIQHNGLRIPQTAEGRKQVSFKGRRGSHRRASRAPPVEVVRARKGSQAMEGLPGPTTPPPIRCPALQPRAQVLPAGPPAVSQ